MKKTNAVIDTLRWFQEPGLLAARETDIIAAVGEPSFEFSDAFALADSFHVHVKVADVARLPVEKFHAVGGIFDNGHEGYLKYRFPDGLNMIFSSVPIAQDDYAESEQNPRVYPFVDHIGIDLRQETDVVREAFGRLPNKAEQLGWGHIPQGGKTRPVYCCHIEVAAKHWIYPTRSLTTSGIPLEFAFGTLKFNDFKSGCDLRPSSPVIMAQSFGATQHSPRYPRA